MVSAPIQVAEAQKKKHPYYPGVAVIECVENRVIDGHLRWRLHCRLRDDTYRLFIDVDEEAYRRLCEEEAEFELMGLGVEPEWL